MTTKTIKAHILGYPRVGAKRELKFALESFWRRETSSEDLQKTAKILRATHWKKQQDADLAFVTTNDFSLYDHMLDHTVFF
nr:5-methyltetrahydropteroyltriglutamate--homocysteine S-methyltransferase [Methylotenera sp.]